MNTVCVRAPSNIALIKYMGKKQEHLNLPENGSLSMTLNHLCSFAELSFLKKLPSLRFDSYSYCSFKKDKSIKVNWIPELPQIKKNPKILSYDLYVPQIDETGIRRILTHVERVYDQIPPLLNYFGISRRTFFGEFQLRTANTFPVSSGIASSASSFAAVTLAGAFFFSDSESFDRAWNSEGALKRAIAQISRQGSGSSCRSFEGPWVLWEHDMAMKIDSKMPVLLHFLVLLESSAKKVSSSEAHRRVKTSCFWKKRSHRVEVRLKKMIHAIKEGDFSLVSKLAWIETLEMHRLFHTSAQPFSYWHEKTRDALTWFHSQYFAQGFLKKNTDVIVTLDAGPNIHVLVEEKNQEIWREKLRNQFSDVILLEDIQGNGAEKEDSWRKC
jgi:diphosphomevalonate decarboxylase